MAVKGQLNFFFPVYLFNYYYAIKIDLFAIYMATFVIDSLTLRFRENRLKTD